MRFRFEVRWKEQLVVHHAGGEFVLEFPMGRPTVCLPTHTRWQEIAPPELRSHWLELHEQLQEYCVLNGFGLELGDNYKIYPA